MVSPYVEEAARRANSMFRAIIGASPVTDEMVRAAQAVYAPRYGYGITDADMRKAIEAALEAGKAQS